MRTVIRPPGAPVAAADPLGFGAVVVGDPHATTNASAMTEDQIKRELRLMCFLRTL
jgi:hypothetical protein